MDKRVNKIVVNVAAHKAGMILITDEGAAAQPNDYALAFLSLGTGLHWEEAMHKLKAAFAKARTAPQTSNAASQ